ncbi:unnamed protein product [Candida parapsilosis]
MRIVLNVTISSSTIISAGLQAPCQLNILYSYDVSTIAVSLNYYFKSISILKDFTDVGISTK